MYIDYFSLILHVALQKLNNLTTLECVVENTVIQIHREYVHTYKYIYRSLFL